MLSVKVTKMQQDYVFAYLNAGYAVLLFGVFWHYLSTYLFIMFIVFVSKCCNIHSGYIVKSTEL